jgi:hypothetical protein
MRAIKKEMRPRFLPQMGHFLFSKARGREKSARVSNVRQFCARRSRPRIVPAFTQVSTFAVMVTTREVRIQTLLLRLEKQPRLSASFTRQLRDRLTLLLSEYRATQLTIRRLQNRRNKITRRACDSLFAARSAAFLIESEKLQRDLYTQELDDLIVCGECFAYTGQPFDVILRADERVTQFVIAFVLRHCPLSLRVLEQAAAEASAAARVLV